MEKNENNVEVSYHQIDNETLYNKVLFKTQKKNQSFGPRDVIVLIDKSGSMSGSPLFNVKQVVLKLIDFFEKNLAISSFTILDFNDEISSLTLNAVENIFPSSHFKSLKEYVNNIKSEGGTIFKNPLNFVADFLTARKNIPILNVVFLTDGEVADDEDKKYNYSGLNTSLGKVKQAIIKHTRKCEFHTLGFSKNHDPILLDNITKLSKDNNGTYQYIEDGTHLFEAFQNISLMLKSIPEIDCYLKSKESEIINIKVKLRFLREEGDHFYYFGEIFMTNQDLDYKNLILETKEYKEKKEIITIFPVDIVTSIEKNDIISLLSIDLNYIYMKLQEFSQKLILSQNKLTEIELDSMNADLVKLKNKYFSRSRDIFKISSGKRSEFEEQIKGILKYFEVNSNLIKLAYKKQITNEKIAEVNSLVYKDVISRKIQKVLDKRTSNNVRDFNTLNHQLKYFKEELQNDQIIKLQKQYEDKLNDIGSCFLSCNNFVEAMKDGDCLCITFNATKDETCLLRPSNIIINDVFPTIISANSFLDSLKFSLRESKELLNSDEGLIKGIANEKINGCLPIFICEEHWKFAKLLIKPILGWTVTLDPFGYAPEQKRSLPFLILNKLASLLREKKSKGENCNFFERIYDEVYLTCLNIMIDDDEKIFDQTWKGIIASKLSIEQYLNCPENRSDDIVSSNQVYITHLAFSMNPKLKWLPENVEIESFRIFFYRVFEEELRRVQRRQTEPSNHLTYYVKLLHILPKKLDDYGIAMLNYAKKENERLTEAKKNKKENKNIQIASETPKPIIPTHKITEIVLESAFKNQTQKETYADFTKLIEKDFFALLDIFKHYFPQQTATIIGDEDTIYSMIGCESKIMWLCLYIQNRYHRKYSERLTAIEEKLFKSYYINQEAVNFLESFSSIVIECESDRIHKWKKEIFELSKINESENTKGLRNTLLLQLMITEDLDDACELFVKLNKKSVKFYIRFFIKKSCTCAFEKLKMIMTGEYNGKIIRYDWKDRIYSAGKRRKVKKLLKIYSTKDDRNDWISLFSNDLSK